ncbi:Zn(2)-C6 fungal-type domain-containing protein [Mycena venus]|uniref:Zn(2)-C6 fungal-type domain-containing protein n=1 Tax=Mycena venus TaxID=2733690 RepID=A0A8H7CZI4_9AGAR|nr:Zn(2)-C6 fungal-type domain-containing protein [Mycena venus]
MVASTGRGQCFLFLLDNHHHHESQIRTVTDDIQVPGGTYTNEYVENLELRLKNAEKALLKIRQPGPHLVSGSLIRYIDPPKPDDGGPHGIAASFQALSLNGPPPDSGYQGESSAAMLVKAAVSVKSGRPSVNDRRAPAPKPWTLQPWDKQSTDILHLSFPDPHLLSCLVSLYFADFNTFVPILHRPTFEDGVARRLHAHQEDFASTLLLVCALGSLYLTGSGMSPEDRQKLAWRWYNQVELCGHSLRRQPTTYDLQAYCLAAHFLLCASNARASWLIVSFGLRIVQDIGGHRRNLKAPTISTEEELEKRATWILVVLDAQLGAALGRMMTLDPFDLDIGLPSECDDKWWELSGPRKQPIHTPSSISFFNCIVDLYRILHFLVKHLYSTSRLYSAAGIDDLQIIATELDVKLSHWFKQIPQHLIWDPERTEAGLFFDQSASLYCFYNYIRMLIHRPFIPAKGLSNQSELRALRTCTKAARTCINIADVHRRRRADVPLFLSQDALFTSAMVLILKMWGRPQHADERAQDLACLHVVLDIFKSQQPRWPSSGFFVIVLERLLTLDYTPGEQLEEPSDTATPESSGDIDTPSDGQAQEPRRDAPWVAFAQAWLAGVVSDQDQTPHSIVAMPPVFAGDQEVVPRQYHRLRGFSDLNSEEPPRDEFDA